MHQFILHSQIAAGRHHQVLNILAGVTAMQPVNVHEQHIVYQQLKKPEIVASKKAPTGQASQAQRPSYHQLVRDVRATAASNEWKFVMEETPDAGIKDVNARRRFENSAGETDLVRFRTGSEWYRIAGQYVVKGSRFIHGNVVIRLLRIHVVESPLNGDPIDSPAPTEENLKIFDASGTYLVEAYVRTVDNASQELRERAMEELRSFAKQLEGAIDLRPAPRLSLDTTVKGT